MRTGIRSARQLALALCVAPITVRRYLQRPDWPVRKYPVWTAADVATINAWRSSVLQEDRAADAAQQTGAAGAVNTGLKLERMLYTRVRRKKLTEPLVDRALVKPAIDSLEALFNRAFDDLLRELPALLAGKDPGVIESILRERIRAARTRLADVKVLQLDLPSDQAKPVAIKP